MSTTELLIKSLEFARARTLGLLDGIETVSWPIGVNRTYSRNDP